MHMSFLIQDFCIYYPSRYFCVFSMIGLLDFIIDGIRNVAKKLYHVIFI